VTQLLIIAAVWAAASLVLALIFGRFMRVVEQRERRARWWVICTSHRSNKP
jgi:hypothetical protein